MPFTASLRQMPAQVTDTSPQVTVPVWFLAVLGFIAALAVVQVYLLKATRPLSGRPGKTTFRAAQSTFSPPHRGGVRIGMFYASIPFAKFEVSDAQLIITPPWGQAVVIGRNEDLRLVMTKRTLRFYGDDWLRRVRFYAADPTAVRHELGAHRWLLR